MSKIACWFTRLICLLLLAGAAAPACAASPPNIIIFLADDSGYSDLGCFGGEIQTPNLDGLAANGLRFTQFYNTARCSPTRASLMTGLYSWQAGIGHLVEDHPQTGYTPALNRKCVTIAEVLKSAGYGTYMAGKWHIGGREMSQLPCQRGFDRYFGTLVTGGGPLPSGGGYYGSDYWLDNTFTNFGSGPFSTDRFTDFALQFLQEHVARTNAPFFLYLAFTAPHFDLTAPPEGVGKYRYTFTNGWERARQERYARQLALGIVRTNWPLSAPEHAFQWTNLSATEQDTQDLALATHAAMVENIDKNVGRVTSLLKSMQVFTNTVIFFLSDNGASNEGGNGGLSTAKRLSTVGANWSNTPWRLYKKFVREGGISTPLIVHWPAGIAGSGIRWQPGHLIDVMPTVLELSGATYPRKFHGNPILPLEGQSLVPNFNSTDITPRTLFFEHEGNRAIRSNDWKLVSIGRNTLSWELFNLAEDRTETTNLADFHPGIVQSLSNAWEAMAWRVNDLPSPDVNNYAKMRSWITVDDRESGDGDGQAEPGEIVSLTVETIKRGSGPNTGLTGVLTALDPNVTVLSGSAAYGDFSSGTAANLTPFLIRINTNSPVNGSMLFALDLKLGAVDQWGDVFALVTRSFARVSGEIIELGSNERLRDVMVAAGGVAATTSDPFGKYELLLETGPYDLQASLEGYGPAQLPLDVEADFPGTDFLLAWTNAGLNIRLDRPYPARIVIPTNQTLELRATVHNGPYPGTGPVTCAWSANGPAAQIADPASADTTVRLAEPGVYKLELSANNGAATATQAVDVLVVSSGALPPPGTNGLVLHYKLDEPPGSATAIDSSGYNHAGTLLNMNTATAWTTGVFSGALRFDGADDVLSVNSSQHINTQTTSQRTVSLWFLADDPSAGAKQTLYEEGGTTRGLNIYLSGGRLYLGGWNRDAMQSDWTGDWISVAAPDPGTWHQVALVLNGGPTVQPDSLVAFLDGVETGRSPGAEVYSRGDAIGFGATYDATRFHDGSTVGQTNGAWFAGVIDDARIYNRVLTELEIAALANASPFSRVVAVDAGPEQPLHSGLAVPLAGQLKPLGPVPYPFAAAWRVRTQPAGATVTFADPETNGVSRGVTVSAAGHYTFRLAADTGDVATCDDLDVPVIRSFAEWIADYTSLAPADRFPGADPDQDFGNNQVEYEVGTPPDRWETGEASRPTLEMSTLPPSDLRMSLWLRRGALDRGLQVRVQRRSELGAGTWIDCPYAIAAIQDSADYEFQRVTLSLAVSPDDLGASANFFRATFAVGVESSAGPTEAPFWCRY